MRRYPTACAVMAGPLEVLMLPAGGPLGDLAALLDVLPLPAYLCDAGGKVVAWNAEAGSFRGAEPARRRRRRFTPVPLYTPAGEPIRPRATPTGRALLAGESVRRAHAQIAQPTGMRIAITVSADPIRDADGCIIGALTCFGEERGDILREEECRALLDGLPAAIYTTDAHGRITFYNAAAAELAGRKPKLGEDEWCVTWRLFWPDGRRMPHDQCPMAVTLKENRPVRGAEAVAERPDGSRFPFIPYPTPLRNDAGELVGAVNMLVDISDRKRAEEALRLSEERYRRLSETLEARVNERTRALVDANERLRREALERERAEAALRQAQKIEAVGQLASGMAHDFNNLLTAIIGNLEFVEQRLDDETLRKMIQAAGRAALRGAKLNAQMLAFSRKQHLAPRSVDLNRLVADMTEMLRRTLGGPVEVSTALGDGLWPALVDPTQLELVVLNLAINARDAMPMGGSVLIETRNVRASDVPQSAGLTSGDYVMVAVSDTGEGMSEEVLARACEPFYTTKEPGRGSGLGLSQVYGVARQSGGGIVLKSAPARGTSVEVYLPRSVSHAEAIPLRERQTGTAPRRRGTVLVVDDQVDVREVAVAHLESLGYQVAQAASGRTALNLLGDGSTIDLLVADYAMPGMSGIELARAARARRPDLAIVIVTGYVEMAMLDRQIDDVLFLKKPYRISELASTVDKALGENGATSGNVVALRSAER